MRRPTSDTLSPILVKELRQGIRSKLFIGSFFCVQVGLFIFGLSLVLTPTVRSEEEIVSFFFWSMLGIPLILMVPTAASQAIEKEVTGKTLELLVLTKLSAYRIVIGKWGAVIVQATLIVTSALPYVILRYFLGGVDVWSELGTVLGLLLASSLLAGIGLGFWATKIARWAKWAAVMLFFWLAQFLVVAMMSPHGGLGLGSVNSMVLWLYSALIMFMMLELAASRIAPPAENRVTRVRALALIGILPVFFWSDPQMQVQSAAGAVLVAGATIIISLSEGIQPVPRLYVPFTRGGALRNLLTAPFCPGWPGGVALAFVCLAILPFVPAFYGELPAMAWVALFGTLFLPVMIVRTLVPRGRKALGYYLLLLILSTVPMYVWKTISMFGPPGELVGQLFSLSPPFILMMALTEHVPGSWALIQAVVSLVSVVVTVRLARRAWSEITVLAQSAAAVPIDEAGIAPVGVTPEGSPS